MEQLVYTVSESFNKAGRNAFCPGCMHSTAHKIICEVLDEMNLRGKCVIVLPVGCAVNSHEYFNTDMLGCLHGRAAATAVGLKHAQKDKLIISYQGDGDAASIGLAESFYAANRGDPITVIMVNNQIYGMTGGQMSPCTLVGQKATTAIHGRNPAVVGYPVHVAEMLAALTATSFVARYSLHDVKHILEAKKGIAKAFDIQLNHNGYSFIELLAACPTNWGIDPSQGPKWMVEKTIPEFPLGVFKSLKEV